MRGPHNLATAQNAVNRSGKKAEADFNSMRSRALKRLEASEAQAMGAIPEGRGSPFDDRSLATNALLLSALSIAVSSRGDVARAGEVFDALRSVNGNYAGLSDGEIWMQCLLLPPESLAGLASLTKGALFEAHVADATGGALHAHFNTPDTDIVIDGAAYQIKATDSEGYIDSVDANIPVIATSEVAEKTGAIDSGMANAELERSTELALGGTVIDVPDTAIDAVMAGLGGLGILATIRGINHAVARHRAGVDGPEAIEEGIGIAVTGTLKATVDIAETGYNIATSRPSRFVGRQMARGLGAVGRAIDGPKKDAAGPGDERKH